MKKIAAIVVIMLFVLLSGCQGLVEHSEREALDNDKTLIIARNRIPVVTSHIAFRRGLGDTEQLNVKTAAAMDEFLVLVEDPNSLSNYDLVYSLGLGVQIDNDIFKKIVERYAPEVLRYWP